MSYLGRETKGTWLDGDNPTLSGEHIDRIRRVAQVRPVKRGEILYEPSEPNVPIYVVLDGSVTVGVDERIIAVRKSGQFTGEMTVISGNRSLLTARVIEDGTLLEVPRDAVLSLMAKDTELGDILMGAFVVRRQVLIQLGEGNVILFGTKASGRTLLLREFLTRNNYPFTYVDLDTDTSFTELIEKLAVRSSEIPVAYYNNRYVLRNPSIGELAACLDLNLNIDTDKSVRDVVVIGAGPAGLAAAVYAASEGLKTLLIEKAAPGGQAGSSSKIENYLGFPVGVSGQELVNRANAQAQKFGAQLIVAQSVVHIDCSRQPYKVILESGGKLRGRSIVIATGAQYARLPIDDADAFAGRGVYYNATHMEAQLCDSEEVVVVGGGNSAGQAAILLQLRSSRVHLLVRAPKLSESMSRYLVARIEAHPRIEIHYSTQVISLSGTAHLENIEWRNEEAGTTEARAIRHVFVMAGAVPRTEWLQDCLVLDKKGFIITGQELIGYDECQWPLERSPLLLETSIPGIFAVGDARAGSVKRVASAVGEGAMAVHLIHRFLAESPGHSSLASH